jgi:hypothetical protein
MISNLYAEYISFRSAAALEGLVLAYLKMSLEGVAQKRGKIHFRAKENKDTLRSLTYSFIRGAHTARQEALKDPNALQHFGNIQVRIPTV